jgi:hypothetical protein
MKMKLVIFAMVVFLITTAAAQNYHPFSKPIHQIGIVLGGLNYQVRDDIIAPLRWDGFGFVGGLSYSLISDKGRHNIDLRVLYSSPSNRYDHKSKIGEINLGYGYMHRVGVNESHRQLQIGGQIDWNYNAQYYENWDDSHIYWLNVYELGPAARWSNTIKDNHQLALTFNFSLIALVSRPPKYRYYDQERLPKEILSKPHEKMELTSLHEYISIGLRGQYKYQVSRKITMGVTYYLNYKTFSKPERISLFSNTLQLNLLFTLGKNKKEKS